MPDGHEEKHMYAKKHNKNNRGLRDKLHKTKFEQNEKQYVIKYVSNII